MEFTIKEVKINGIVTSEKKGEIHDATIFSFWIDDKEVTPSAFLSILGKKLYGNHLGFYSLFEVSNEVALELNYHPSDREFSRECSGFNNFLLHLNFTESNVDIARLLVNPKEGTSC